MPFGQLNGVLRRHKNEKEPRLKEKCPLELHIVYHSNYQRTSTDDVPRPSHRGHCIRYSGFNIAEVQLGRRGRPYLTLSQTHASRVEGPCCDSETADAAFCNGNIKNVDGKVAYEMDDNSSKRGDDNSSKRGDDNSSKRGDDNSSKKGDDKSSKSGDDNSFKKGDDNSSKKGDDNSSKRGDDNSSKRLKDDNSKKGDNNRSRRSNDNSAKQGNDNSSKRVSGNGSKRLSDKSSKTVNDKSSKTVNDNSPKRVDNNQVLAKSDVLEVSKNDVHSCTSTVGPVSVKAASVMVLPLETCIPFNPFGANREEAEKNKLYSRSGEAFVVLNPMDPNITHICDDGSELPEYRWGYRRWLFSRFDEGINVDGTGFMEVSPEPVAQHIARRMAAYTEGVADGITSQPLMSDEQISLMPGTVVESCAGYGGNTIQFAKRFTHVCAIDTDACRLRQAQRNAEIYQIPEGRIEWVAASFETWLEHNGRFQNGIKHPAFAVHNGACTDVDRTNQRLVSTYETAPVIQSTNKCNIQDSDEPLKGSFSDIAAVHDAKGSEERNCSNTRPVVSREYLGNSAAESDSTSALPKLQNKPVAWFFMSPPWGGETYKKLENFSLGIFYSHVVSASRFCRNLCLYLPANQDILELVELSSKISNCALLVLESISIGLTKKTKYIVAYFLDEETAVSSYPMLHTAVARCACLELGENVRFMSRSFEFLCKELGVHQLQRCLQEAIRLYTAGGLQKNSAPGVARTFGGVFFADVKERFPNAYKNLNKFRKREAAQVSEHRNRLKKPSENKIL